MREHRRVDPGDDRKAHKQEKHRKPWNIRETQTDEPKPQNIRYQHRQCRPKIAKSHERSIGRCRIFYFY